VVLPLALLDDDGSTPDLKVVVGDEDTSVPVERRQRIPLKRDPYGRDFFHHFRAKGEWSVEPLAKYVHKVALQIESNLQKERMPTTDKLDAYVSRLVANIHRFIKHAPKKVRNQLQRECSRKLQKFWHFVRNEKMRAIKLQELGNAVTSLDESLISDFGIVHPECPESPTVR